MWRIPTSTRQHLSPTGGSVQKRGVPRPFPERDAPRCFLRPTWISDSGSSVPREPPPGVAAIRMDLRAFFDEVVVLGPEASVPLLAVRALRLREPGGVEIEIPASRPNPATDGDVI